MKIQLVAVGKAHDSYVKEGIDLFTKRISNYFTVQWQIIPMARNAGLMNGRDLKNKEGEAILNYLKKDDFLILMDERGKKLTSEGVADFIQKRANESVKQLLFLIGGAYGVSDEVAKRANYTLSLSSLVFPHQLVRLILAEQIYRACSIMRNEKYHHE